MDRDAVIARYRELRAILMQHNSAVLRHVSRQSMLDQARRLGMLMGETIVADGEDGMVPIFDLAIYSPRRRNARPIDRYRRTTRPPPDSDEARVLEAMCGARFAVWAVERRHDIAGLVVRDLMRETELWLMDLNLAATAKADTTFASHLLTVGPFSMTTGMIVPVEPDALLDALDDLPPARLAAPQAVADDPLFATLLCRAALAHGAMEHIRYA